MVGLLPALGLGALWWGAAERAAANLGQAAVSQPAGEQPAAALLSARRAPGVLAAQTKRADYVAALAGVLPAGSADACFTVELDGSRLVEVNPEVPLVPASNVKLVTASVALEVLGAEHAFTTTVHARRDGPTVTGDLYLVGGGDATLATDDFDSYPASAKDPQHPRTSLDRLADQIVAAGIRRIDGAIVGDGSRYDGERYVEAWQPAVSRGWEAGPLGALLVDDGFANRSEKVATGDPAAGAAAHLRELLVARGVDVAGGSRSGTAPAEVPALEGVATSIALPALLKEMLTTSDNNTAELLLKEIGLVRAGTGSTEAGLQVEHDVLASWGLPLDGVKLADGSGLSDQNRLRCPTLVALLDHVGRSGPVYDGLAIAGFDGTLAEPFAGTELAGKLFGKTGTLTGVKSLSGFVDNGDQLTFSLLINGPGAADRGAAAWRALAAALGGQPAVPDAAALAPGA